MSDSHSVVSDFVTPWTVACPGPLSMEFSRQECWRGLSLPSPGDLLNPGTEPESPALQTDVYHLSHQGTSRNESLNPCHIQGEGIVQGHRFQAMG